MITDAVDHRVNLERDLLENLEKHQRTLNPKIKESSVWTLVSPLFEYFETEIQHRRDAYDSLVVRLDTIPEPDHPNTVIQDDISPLDWYQQLAEANSIHSRCYEVSRSPDSISSLVEWYQRDRPGKDLVGLTDAELMTYEIPKIDQDYRHSVLEQNRVATEMQQWHEEKFTTSLEAHHQQVEDINIALRQIIETHNDLCFTLVKSCSATLLAISRFSSLRFIDAAYDGQRAESSHPYFTRVSYFNFSLAGQSSVVFYGTDKALDCLWERWGSRYFFHEILPNIPRQLEEERTLFGTPSDTILATKDSLVFAFLSMPPLLPLTDEDIKRFAKGIPRSKMSSFMRRFPISQRTKIWKYMKDMKTNYYWPCMAVLLSHRNTATGIVEDIWAKWDFDRNDTLPAKTIRVGPGRNSFKNTGTGEVYLKE